MDQILGEMERIAIVSGYLIMKFWDDEVRSRLKDDKSIVTEADDAVSAYLRNELPGSFPECGILTEETEDTKERLEKREVIIADELDGSGDFKRKERDFCTTIAYVDGGTPIRGVVFEPLKKRLFAAKKGEGVYMAAHDGVQFMERRVQSLLPITWENAIVGHPKNYKGDKYTRLYEAMGIPEERLLKSGSMGTRMMQIVMGETHMILGYTRSLKEWDTAAGQVILEEMGFSVTDRDGNPLRYNKENPVTENGIFIFHPDIKDEGLERIAQAKDKVEM